MRQRCSEAGLTIVETTIALTVLVLGGLLVAEALQSSEGAARSDTNLSRALRSGDSCLRLLGQELTQSTTQTDPDLPPDDQQRVWLLTNGVRFQKVIGQEVTEAGTVAQTWSPPITYLLNGVTGDIWRTEEGGASRRVASGAVEFSVAIAGAQVEVTLETRAGSAGRGTEAAHRRVVRVTTRNALQ